MTSGILSVRNSSVMITHLFRLPVVSLFLFVAAAASVLAVTPADLRRNPLWLPETTTLKKGLAFADGTSIQAGQSLRISGIDNKGCQLWFPDGKSIFSVDISDTTLIQDADARLATFTPEQQKLTPAALRNRKELWPYTVQLRDEQAWNDGTVLAAGKSFPLMEFDGRQLNILQPEKNVTYRVDPAATDFYAACLQAVVTPPPASRLYQELATGVVDAATLEPVDFLHDGGPEYLAIYYTAGWCPYSAQATPDVMKWYAGLKDRDDSHIKLLIVSRDKSIPEMKDYLKKIDFSSLLVPFDKVNRMFLLNQTTVLGSIPHLVVVDRSGKLVIPGGSGQPKDRIDKVLKQIEAL
ncbi:hypothetical protein OpiT1DRAFT_00363 [Opitutaceae bacterium TAV1]|nr:hypothetical protein OPIT5_25945 [Opitutaceae bacterium TAV5]EIQ01788.1 hypothetical protein OpiT1DRAFT_00363 [Opitutaceae bacterium TAV1]